MDLQSAAQVNAAKWTERGDVRCAEEPRLTRLRDLTHAIRIGTNVDPGKLIAFRERTPPALVSTYDVRAAQMGPEAAENATYQTGAWGPRRGAFEAAIGGLRTTVYGTLDLPSSAGDDRYGTFRLVYEPLLDAPPAVLPHNSALIYGANGLADEDAITEDAAAWAQRADVAIEVLADELLSTSEAGWSAVLPRESHDDLVEVVICGGARPLSSIAEYRVSRRVFEAMLLGNGDALDALAGTTGVVDEVIALAHALAAESEAGAIALEEVDGPTW